jgi:hypothetical protein
MATLWLRKDVGGWRHYIGDEPIYCGNFIEAQISGEWVTGRYETDDLSPTAPMPKAYLYASEPSPFILEEGTEAKFPIR